jgi:hypothetical protein
MTYAKPQINTLGDAVSVILGGTKVGGDIDFSQPDHPRNLQPAYDLDE